jgi:hypothetical protein
MRLFKISLVILALLCIGWGPMMLGTKQASLTCTLLESVEAGAESQQSVAQFAGQSYTGTRWTAPGNGDICRIEWYQTAVVNTAGGPALYDFYVSVFTMTGGDLDQDGGGDCDFANCESDKTDGDNDADTWVTHDFDTPVSVTNAVEYAIGIKMCTDGAGAGCAPQNDADDYSVIAYVNEGADTTFNGRYTWQANGTANITAAGDDPWFRIYTMQ